MDKEHKQQYKRIYNKYKEACSKIDMLKKQLKQTQISSISSQSSFQSYHNNNSSKAEHDNRSGFSNHKNSSNNYHDDNGHKLLNHSLNDLNISNTVGLLIPETPP